MGSRDRIRLFALLRNEQKVYSVSMSLSELAAAMPGRELFLKRDAGGGLEKIDRVEYQDLFLTRAEANLSLALLLAGVQDG